MLLTTCFATICLMLVCMTISAFCSRGKGPVYCLFVAYFLWMLLIPGWIQSSYDRFFWNEVGVSQAKQLEAIAILFVFLGIFEVMTAYQTFIKGVSPSEKPNRYFNLPVFELEHLALSSALAMGFTMFAIRMVGLDVFTGGRDSIGDATEDLSTAGIFSSAPRAIAGAHIAMVLSSLSAFSGNPAKRILVKAFIILASLVSAVCLWPTSLPRFVLLGFLVTCASILFRRNALFLKISLCTLFPVGLYTIVPVIGTYNRTSSVDLDELFTLPDFSEILYAGDYDSFEWIAHTAEYVDEFGISYGMNILSAVLFMIPRSIFPFKYEPTGSIVAESVGSDFLNVSCPLPAEAYFAFSWVGVVLMALFCGYWIPWLDRQLLRGKNVVSVVLAACVMGQLCILLRGSLLGVSNFVMVEIFWIYMIPFCFVIPRLLK